MQRAINKEYLMLKLSFQNKISVCANTFEFRNKHRTTLVRRVEAKFMVTRRKVYICVQSLVKTRDLDANVLMASETVQLVVEKI